MSQKTQGLEAFLNAVSPHVSNDVRKGIDSIRSILALFPGQSAGDAYASIKKLLASAMASVDVLIERARQLVQPAWPEGSAPESVEAFIKDAGKLALGDLKALLNAIGLPAPKTKKAVLVELKQWIESKGVYAPKSESDKKRERAEQLVSEYPRKMGQMTSALADEIIRRAEEAATDKLLGADGFAMFASLLLGMPMKGTKTKLLNEIKSFVNRLAVSASQTSGF